MITARRINATERHGAEVHDRRPTAIRCAATASISVLSVAVVLSLGGCASRNTGSAPVPADSAAAHRADQNAHAAAPAPRAAGPTASITTSSAPITDDTTALAQLTGDLVAAMAAPALMFTPPAAPGVTPTRKPLVIISMPMWLWVNAPAEQVAVTAPANHLDVAAVVIDKVVWRWTPDGTTTAAGTLTCDGSSTNQGPGLPYDAMLNPTADPTDAANRHEACITRFSAPFYSVDAGGNTVGDGLYDLSAAINWHVATSVDGGVTFTAGAARPLALAPPAANPVQFRVGEIQALAVGP